MRKDELRQHIREIKRQFSRQQLEELSLPIISRLKSRLASTKTILAYYSLPDEVDTRQLLDDLVAEGKTVLLPKVIDDENMNVYDAKNGTNDVLNVFFFLVGRNDDQSFIHDFSIFYFERMI